jgi:lysophospholipase
MMSSNLHSGALPAPADHISLPESSSWASLRAADGVALRAAFWAAEPAGGQKPLGTTFVLQGRAEFIEKYAEVISELLQRGYAVATLDWRGQGGSQRLLAKQAKGHVEDFPDYLMDLDCLVAEARRRSMPEPFNILSHSMGGAITLLALARGPSPFARAVISAPLVRIHGVQNQGYTRGLAKLLVSLGFSTAFVPFGGDRSVMDRPFEGNPLTQDPARYRRSQARVAANRHLALGDATIGWVDAALDALAGMEADSFGNANRTPILMLLAGADTVVDTRAAERLALRMRGASAIVIPTARHEILMETDDIRGEFWAAFDAFAARHAEHTGFAPARVLREEDGAPIAAPAIGEPDLVPAG